MSLIEDLYLMANSTTNIKLQVPEKKCKPGDIVEVVPLESFIELIYPNVISEIDDNYHVSLTLFNYSNAPIIFPQGTNLAQIELVQLPNEHDQPLICAISTPESTNPDLDFYALIEANTFPEFCSAMKDIGSLYRDVFVVKDEPTGYTNHMPFRINTGQGFSIAQRPYRVPVAHQAEVEKQLESMQREGIITLSKSPWASPMVVVKKRMVVFACASTIENLMLSLRATHFLCLVLKSC